MKRLPFVSVIVPTLNEEKYIEFTLKALKAQDYKGKYEIIVADGNSKDNTVKIAKKYVDKVIVVKKKGVSAGKNAGAREAEGEILVFIDADTVATFNLLTEIVKKFEEGVVGVTCPIMPLSAKITEFLLFWMYGQFVKISLKTKTPQVTGVCVAYERKAFEKIGGFNENIRFCEDFDISERISKLGKIVCTDSAFVMTFPRRIRKWGKIKSIIKYVKFYLMYKLAGKMPKINEYAPIR
ncbi:MAG: glycosyltransferase [Candidatus Aenigmatarchaeota archaeon]